MQERPDLKTVSDEKLLHGLFEILKKTRHDEADLVAHIAEIDARKLYAREAAHSMFSYCTEVLHLSEPEAALRIRVARASRKHPMLLTILREGRIHLSGIALLAPLLTRENRVALLKRATHKSKRQIEEMIAELKPVPEAPPLVRRLPRRGEEAGQGLDGPVSPTGEHRPDAAAPASSQHEGSCGSQQRPDAVALANPQETETWSSRSDAEPLVPPDSPSKLGLPGGRGQSPPLARPATVEPVGPARFRVRIDASRELRDKLERLQALMRSSVPDGDLAKIIDLAVTEKLERLEARRFAKTKKPRTRVAQADTRPKSRYIPAAVRRFVEKRDGGRCTYRDRHARRCTQRHDLEFHHRIPFGLGGEHSPEGIALLCKTHNQLLADEDFGTEKMARYRRRESRVSQPATVRSRQERGQAHRAIPGVGPGRLQLAPATGV